MSSIVDPRPLEAQVDDYAWAATVLMNERDGLAFGHPRSDYLTQLLMEMFRECTALGIGNEVGVRITELRSK